MIAAEGKVAAQTLDGRHRLSADPFRTKGLVVQVSKLLLVTVHHLHRLRCLCLRAEQCARYRAVMPLPAEIAIHPLFRQLFGAGGHILRVGAIQQHLCVLKQRQLCGFRLHDDEKFRRLFLCRKHELFLFQSLFQKLVFSHQPDRLGYQLPGDLPGQHTAAFLLLLEFLFLIQLHFDSPLRWTILHHQLSYKRV